MKVELPDAITTIPQAEGLTELINNNLHYHPEDDAHEIGWGVPDADVPTPAECDHLNKLMEDIYNLPGNDGRHNHLAFDPCEFILDHDGSGWRDVADPMQDALKLSAEEFKEQHDKNFRTKYLKGEE